MPNDRVPEPIVTIFSERTTNSRHLTESDLGRTTPGCQFLQGLAIICVCGRASMPKVAKAFKGALRKASNGCRIRGGAGSNWRIYGNGRMGSEILKAPGRDGCEVAIFPNCSNQSRHVFTETCSNLPPTNVGYVLVEAGSGCPASNSFGCMSIGDRPNLGLRARQCWSYVGIYELSHHGGTQVLSKRDDTANSVVPKFAHSPPAWASSQSHISLPSPGSRLLA